ncbi:double C2-like domain-containing protein, putative [Plasmodium ovale wallikeri]|uniref:Double C2-like domain-containing protein, putative n=1 Tax=Plasmodium ovale wallikeri TaxID=864142 RepID=A0A1A9A1Y1_PLAOA|nr:double C2-like domain-containing protein, putative [Plasmodium ovale wallikeri]SBT50475.1 double C2-like domain-containing protein, putative [Plasmodium ovale wallikeri]
MPHWRSLHNLKRGIVENGTCIRTHRCTRFRSRWWQKSGLSPRLPLPRLPLPRLPLPWLPLPRLPLPRLSLPRLPLPCLPFPILAVSQSSYSKNTPGNIEENPNEPNIARYLYGKMKKKRVTKGDYNYDEPHYGKDMNMMSYKEMKNCDLFRGFIEPPAKSKKKILLVKRE